MRVEKHPILGEMKKEPLVEIKVDEEIIEAIEGEPIAAAVLGYLILSEQITIWYLVGGFFLLLAIINIVVSAD